MFAKRKIGILHEDRELNTLCRRFRGQLLQKIQQKVTEPKFFEISSLGGSINGVKWGCKWAIDVID